MVTMILGRSGFDRIRYTWPDGRVTYVDEMGSYGDCGDYPIFRRPRGQYVRNRSVPVTSRPDGMKPYFARKHGNDNGVSGYRHERMPLRQPVPRQPVPARQSYPPVVFEEDDVADDRPAGLGWTPGENIQNILSNLNPASGVTSAAKEVYSDIKMLVIIGLVSVFGLAGGLIAYKMYLDHQKDKERSKSKS